MDSYDGQPSPGRGRESDAYRRRSPGKITIVNRTELIVVIDTDEKKVFLKTAGEVVPHAAARDRLP
jgi:hypothetical protein